MVHFGRVFFGILLSAAFLSACGHKEGSTQVVAKVNGDEITVHELSDALARVGTIPKGKEHEAGKQVLKSLVDQQILVKMAIDKKLDRNPNVLQAIEAFKRQTLAQASLEQFVQQVTKPTDTEIHDYYVKSPELFSDRRIYKFAEVALDSKVSVDKVKQLLSGTKSLDQFMSKLHKENIEFRTNSTVKAAEELPIALLPKFSKMAKGEVAVIPTGDSLSVLQLQDFKEQPVAEGEAKPFIGKFLLEQKRKALIETEMKKLRDAAKIEYLGAYADTGEAPVGPGATQPASAVTAASPLADSGKADAANDSHVKKGLSGL